MDRIAFTQTKRRKSVKLRGILFKRQRLPIATCLFILVSITAGLTSISFIPSSLGVVEEADRGTSLYYHNNSVDQLWYGTDSWAVRFNIGTYTTLTDTLTLQKTRVYFPQESGTYSLKIYTDRLQPLNNLAFQRDDITVNRGWNEIVLSPDEYLTGSIFWIVVEYETDATERYMAASRATGSNSYYWVPENNDIRGHFANMEENSMFSEFLVTIVGELDIEGIDLELVSFSLGGNVEPGGRVHPVLEIKNNSSELIDDRVNLHLDLTNPTSTNISFRSVPIQVTIAPGETIEIAVTGYTANLSETPAEYSIVATLIYDDDKFTANNIARYSFNTLPHVYRMSLVENFVRTEDTPSRNIQNEQEEITDHNFRRLNLFFHPQDRPHYKADSAVRRDFYGLSGYPFTVINGREQIAGHSSSYKNDLAEKMTETAASNTFITFAERSERLQISRLDMLMNFEFTLRNTNSYPLESTLNNIRLFVALTEKEVTGTAGNNLIYLYRCPDVLTLGNIENYRLEWELSLQPINTIEHELNADNLEYFEIIYWVQDTRTKKIYFVGSFNLSDFRLDAESITLKPEAVNISLHPNPFSGINNLSITLSETQELGNTVISYAEIFDIRGRLIKAIDGEKSGVLWNGQGNDGVLAPNGIYFIKIFTEQVNGDFREPLPVQYKKVNIIR